MKLTRNAFRMKFAVAAFLLGLLMLTTVDWKYVHARARSPLATWLNTHRWERRQKEGPFLFAGLFIAASIALAFEFKGDRPRRNDL